MEPTISTGHNYCDVVTDYWNVIPKVITVSRSNSIVNEQHENGHTTSHKIATHWTLHMFTVLSFTFTKRDRREVDSIRGNVV